MAHNVLQVLKNLTAKEKTIILTIHQPSSEIFCLFDKLLLMANGRIAFHGTPNEAYDFFASLDAPCPTNYNPADFYVETLAVVPGKEEESRETIRKICDAFAVSEYQTKIYDEISALQSSSNAAKLSNGMINGNHYRATWWMQFRAILWRSWLTVLKEPLLVRVRLCQTVVRCNQVNRSIRLHLCLSDVYFSFTVSCISCWCDFLRSNSLTGWSDEYQWGVVFIFNEYDISKCVVRC